MIPLISSSKCALKQHRFLEALTNRLKEIDDPNADIIIHDSYKYHSVTLKHFGIIPKITFAPYGKSTQIKAEIMRTANLYDEPRQQEIAQIREKYSLKKARETETRILARLFESYWNNYWRSIKTALKRIEQAQKLFITQSNSEKNETISKPMRILMGNVADIKETKEEEEKQEKKSYADELMEVG